MRNRRERRPRERAPERATVQAPARRQASKEPTANPVLSLQRTAGNRAVARLLQRAVAEAAPKSKRKLVCWGAKGADVSFLQRRLNLAPEVKSLLDVDGDFGPKTYAAVKQFQRAHPPLKVDGIVGEETWAAVEAIPDEPQDRKEVSFKYYGAGAAQFTQGRYGQAYDLFSQAGEYAPDDPVYLYNRAQALRFLGGRRKEAIALYEQFIEQADDKAGARAKEHLAELRGPAKTGDKDADTKAANALYDRGVEAYTAGRYGEAYDLFEAAGELAPDDPVYLFNRAQALRWLGGRRKEAMALYEQFITKASGKEREKAQELLGLVRGPGRTGDKKADTKAANELYDRGVEAYTAGRYGEAYDLFEAAGELAPDDPVYLFNRAQALRRLGGRREEAIALFEAFIAKVGEKHGDLAKRLLSDLKVPGGPP